jgi:UDP-glucose 4-epimerase
MGTLEKMRVLVTGGAGYIGSHAVQLLLQQGHDVVVLDNLSTGNRDAIAPQAKFILGDVCDGDHTEKVLSENQIEAVMHFAAKLVVPESIEKPAEYYDTNVAGGLRTIQACLRAGVHYFIFSSTAAVYGQSEKPVNEEVIPRPVNPYGASKLMMERMLSDVGNANPNFKWIAMRYFNVAGASINGANGQRNRNATHLIKTAAETAAGIRPEMYIFGSDYETNDGTCVRDYVHVDDLADAHVAVLNGLISGRVTNEIFNCGYGRGSTVREVIAAMKEVSGKNFPIKELERRRGDAASVVADARKIREKLGWQPKVDCLKTICKTAFEWELRQL